MKEMSNVLCFFIYIQRKQAGAMPVLYGRELLPLLPIVKLT
jgi:hypothetical protein